MNATTLAVIDGAGALALFAAARQVQPPLRWAVLAFGAYAAYGAYMHATRSIRITVL